MANETYPEPGKPNGIARRPVLTLPGKAPNGAAEAKAATEKRPAREPYQAGRDVREFEIPDGRPMAIHRHAVRFACPAKTDPEAVTIVGLKDSDGACPIKIAYAEFVAWWREVCP